MIDPEEIRERAIGSMYEKEFREFADEIERLRALLAKVNVAIETSLWKCWHGGDRFEECNELAALVSEAVKAHNAQVTGLPREGD